MIAEQTFTFERTRDWGLIRSVISHPKVYAFVADDFSPPAAEWQPVRDEAFLYVTACEDGELIGIWTFVPENKICWQVHTCILPNGYGRASSAGRELAEWLWKNTDCLRVTTNVPENNRLALRLAKAVGFVEFGFNPASYVKNGRLIGQYLLGLSRPVSEGTCQ